MTEESGFSGLIQLKTKNLYKNRMEKSENRVCPSFELDDFPFYDTNSDKFKQIKILGSKGAAFTRPPKIGGGHRRSNGRG